MNNVFKLSIHPFHQMFPRTVVLSATEDLPNLPLFYPWPSGIRFQEVTRNSGHFGKSDGKFRTFESQEKQEIRETLKKSRISPKPLMKFREIKEINPSKTREKNHPYRPPPEKNTKRPSNSPRKSSIKSR